MAHSYSPCFTKFSVTPNGVITLVDRFPLRRHVAMIRGLKRIAKNTRHQEFNEAVQAATGLHGHARIEWTVQESAFLLWLDKEGFLDKGDGSGRRHYHQALGNHIAWPLIKKFLVKRNIGVWKNHMNTLEKVPHRMAEARKYLETHGHPDTWAPLNFQDGK